MEHKKSLTYTQIIAASFLLVILTGSVLLCFPFSSRTGEWTSYLSCLFTATSATCVTGLIVVDTYMHWSFWGQLIIILLIQIGGLGLMTMITMISLFLRKKLALHQRRLLMQSAGTMQLSGVVRTIKRILGGTALFEGVGALVLFLRFRQMMPTGQAIWYGIFHSISAFCNAGFDLMGQFGESSFTSHVGDVTINVTIMSLIAIGGLGFLVWDDLIRCRFSLRKLAVHSKVVLTTTAILIFGGALIFYFTERNGVFAGMPTGTHILASFFQSVTPRTAGFNTVDQSALSESGSLLTIILMFIGGSPGSTAGGIKTVTLAVFVVNTIRCARNENNVVMFKRRIEPETVRQAGAIISTYLAGMVVAVMIICAIEPYTIRQVLFEVTSAIGTVGLSMNLTSSLGSVSRIILILLMYMGRIGGLSLGLALAEKRDKVQLDRPTAKLLIG